MDRPVTPMMQRYLEVKAQTPGTLLLFRMGDFYELFYEDAEVAARVLGLTLTSRDKGSPNPVAMAGFPYHALDGYLQHRIEGRDCPLALPTQRARSVEIHGVDDAHVDGDVHAGRSRTIALHLRPSALSILTAERDVALARL